MSKAREKQYEIHECDKQKPKKAAKVYTEEEKARQKVIAAKREREQAIEEAAREKERALVREVHGALSRAMIEDYDDYMTRHLKSIGLTMKDNLGEI